MIGRFQCLVIDCPAPGALAPFYEQLLGLERIEESPEWITSRGADGVRVAFQRVDHYAPPDWGEGNPPQQMHLDVLVDDLDEGEVQVLTLGASLLDGSDMPIGFRVYADPVGHPFCLVTAEGWPRNDTTSL